MYFTPREYERLWLASGADLARRRLSRGASIGASEAIALVCDEVLEMAWDGTPLADIVDAAKRLIPADRLLPDVAALVPVIQVEALFPHGTVLVHIAEPFGETSPNAAGAVHPADAEIELASGRERRVARLHNTGALPIWVSSHVPLDGLNPALEVELPDARHFRLDVPAGLSVRIDPQQIRNIGVVRMAGAR